MDIPDSGVSNAYPGPAPTRYSLVVLLLNANPVILNGTKARGMTGCQVEEYLGLPVTLR